MPPHPARLPRHGRRPTSTTSSTASRATRARRASGSLRDLHDDGVPRRGPPRRPSPRTAWSSCPVERVAARRGASTPARELAEKAGLSVERPARGAARAFGLPVPPPTSARYDRRATSRSAEALKAMLDAGVAARARSSSSTASSGRAHGCRSRRRRARWSPTRCFKPGVTEHDVGVAAAAAAPRARAADGARRSRYAFEAHLRELVRSDVISAADIAAGRTPGAREMTVAFADLVGFTRLGEEIDRRGPRRASSAAWRTLAAELRRAAGDVRQDDRRRGDARLARSPTRSSTSRSRCSSDGRRATTSRSCASGSPAAPRSSAAATGTAARSTWPAA